jgi:hypothetical protein
MNGENGRSGAPTCFTNRTLAKNAMLALYRNPMSAKDLAIEMGIALPYMEDELSNLVRSTLLRKNGDKYETAIFIASAKLQEKCCAYIASAARELTETQCRALVLCANTFLMKQLKPAGLNTTRQTRSPQNAVCSARIWLLAER